MTDQENYFSNGEGDAYFQRNRAHLETFDPQHDPVARAVDYCSLKPKRIIEYGCALGSRLAWMANSYDAEAIGIEPGSEAIATCEKHGHSINGSLAPLISTLQ